MINSDEINAAILSKVTEAVNEQVTEIFKNDDQLIASLRSQAVSLLVRNFNLDAVVKQGMSEQVAGKVAELIVEGDGTLLDANVINDTVANNVADATSESVTDIIKNDAALLGQLKTHAITELVRKITIGNDVESIIADKIAEQFAAEFNGVGIHNEATQREVTIMDDAVVVENTLTSRNVSVIDQLATKNATISGKLIVHGTVDTTGGAWDGLASSIKLDVVDSVKQEMIDGVIDQVNVLNFKEVQLNGDVVLSDDTLGRQITKSSLTTVGKLDGLTVSGTSTIDALHVEGKRVGINTKTPNAALDVWEDEVEITAGKLKENTAFFGTNRAQDLVIGVNRSADLTIDTSGVTTIKKLKLGSRSIAQGTSVPGYSGIPGDLVLNTQMTLDNPIFAWYCLHDFSWVPLKAVI